MARRLLPLLLLLALAGCGAGAGEEREGGARLTVTRDFGQVRLDSARIPTVREGDTVLRFLAAHADVGTRYGGRFVQSIDGLEGEGPGGRRDWFYYVNGLEARVGAAERRLSPGDRVQWDFRRWDVAMNVPAIVGAYPEPFVTGSGGKKLPVRLECAQEDSAACEEVERRLITAGAQVNRAALGAAGGGDLARIAVGRSDELSVLRAVANLRRGPERSGVWASFSAEGRLELREASGRVGVVAAPGSGLVAATSRPDRQVLWLVTGDDDAGVLRAARALDPEVLRDRYSLAVLPTGPVPLPLGAESAQAAGAPAAAVGSGG